MGDNKAPDTLPSDFKFEDAPETLPADFSFDDVKKKPSIEPTGSASKAPAKQDTKPSSENGSYQWSSGVQTPLETGGLQGGNIAPVFNQEVGAKIGTKKIGEYLTDKSREQLTAKNQIEEAKTTSQFLSQSANFKQYTDKLNEYNSATDPVVKENLAAQLEQIKSLPLAISTAPKQEESVILPIRDEEPFFKGMPDQLKNIKTVGDAVALSEKLPAQFEKGQQKYKQAQSDIDEVVTPLRENAKFDVNEHGIHEYGVKDAFLKGALHVVDKTASALQMMGAKDDAELLSILKNNQGMQNVAFPEKADGVVSGAVEMGSGLLPYFAAGGAGTVGSMVANGLMMGATGYAEGMQRGFDERLAQTGNEQEALETAKNIGKASGISGAAVGSVGLPAMGVLGAKTASKLVGSAEKLNLPQYLKYSLPKNAIANLPFPLQTYIDNKVAQSEGLNRGSFEGVGESLATAVTMGMLIDGLHYGGSKIAPKVKSAYETALAKFAFPQTVEGLNKQVSEGNMTREEADKILVPVTQKAAALEKIPELTIKEEAAILPDVVEVDNLQKEKERSAEAFHPAIDAAIEAKNNEIREKLGSPLTEKETKEYEKLVEKKEATNAEGKKTPLMQHEKDRLKHFESRIKAADKNKSDALTETLKEFPLPEKPTDEMNSSELNVYAKKVEAHNKKVGKIDEGALTAEQKDLYGGKNLPKGVYDPIELKRMANRIEGLEGAETAMDIAEWAKRPLLKFAKDKDAESLAVLKAAKKQADKLGVDILPEIENVIREEYKGDADLILENIKQSLTDGGEVEVVDEGASVGAEDKGGEESVPVGEVETPVEQNPITEETIPDTNLTHSEALKFIDDHAVQGSIQKSDYRPDFKLSSQELTRGLKQIKEGKLDGAAAKKVLAKINEWKENGSVDMLAGGGGTKSAMDRQAIPYEVVADVADLTNKQLAEVPKIHEEILSKEAEHQKFLEDNGYVNTDGTLNLDALKEALNNPSGEKHAAIEFVLGKEGVDSFKQIIENETSNQALPETTSKSQDTGLEEDKSGSAKDYQVTTTDITMPDGDAGKNITIAKPNGEVVDVGNYYPEDVESVSAKKIKGFKLLDSKAKKLAEKTGKELINEGWDDIKEALGTPTGGLALNPKLVTGFAKIGYGLIKEGGATAKNVIEKIKEYIKGNGGYKGFSEKDFNESEADIKAKIAELNQKSFLETMKDSPQTTEEMKKAVEELDQFYQILHNKDAVASAKKEIGIDIGEAKKKVLSNSAPSAEKSALAIMLIKHYEKVKDYDSAIEIVNAYDNQLRESGRFIQAASMWNKMAPETVLRTFNKEAEKLGKKLDPEVQKTILGRMGEVDKMPEGTERDKATLEVLNYMADQFPNSIWELIDAYRYQNMLSNPRSHERNIYGNLLNVFLTEPASLAMKSGFDMLANPNNPVARDAKIGQVAKYYQDALMNIPNAFHAARETFSNGYVADKILDIGNTTSQIEALRRTKLPKYLTVATRFLEAQDRFFSVLIGQGEKMRLMRNGVGETEATSKATKLSEEYLYREKLDASDNTKAYAVRALDALGQGIGNMRKLPVIGHPMSWFVPFITTPVNVAKMGVKFSPLGFIGGDHNKAQIANATLGTIATGVGATMAMQGLTSWAAPKDKKERELFYASGRKPYSVKIGDTWVTMQYFGPFGLSLALPAAVKHFQEDTKTSLTDSEIEKVKDAIMSVSGYITSSTPLSGADGFFKAIGGDADYTVDKVLGYVSSQFIPLQGMVRYINTILDPVYRKSKGYVESIQSGIPELSKELEPIQTPDKKDAERDPSNAMLPYDLGFTNQEYEILLKNRREQQQKRTLDKESKKDTPKNKSARVFN